MTKIELSAETLKQAEALGQIFNEKPEQAIGRVVERFHAAYLGGAGKLPEGWQLRDDLSLDDIEAWFAYYNQNPGTGSIWEERGRTIRAAIAAGWFAKPEGLTVEATRKLKPAEAIGLNDAVDAHYIRLTTADPK